MDNTTPSTVDETYMRLAIAEAKKAEQINEVPIGAVIVYDGEVIATGYNKRESQQKALGHAELIAIERANERIGSWRLKNCTMYVTLEPCPMCAGALVQARVKRIVYGATDPKSGCVGTLMNLVKNERFNHQVDWTRGVLEGECSQLLTDFFKQLRQKKSKK